MRSIRTTSHETTFGRWLCFGSLVLLMSGLLGGCAVTSAVWDNQEVRAPAKLPGLAVGQPAYLYVGRLPYIGKAADDVEAWKRTGLFSSVTQTSHPEPVKSGAFISVDCEHVGTRTTSDFFSGMVTVMTLFAFPGVMQEHQFSCTLVYYQDAIRLAKTSADVSFRELRNGWGLIPLWLREDAQNKTLSKDSSTIRVNNLLKAIK